MTQLYRYFDKDGNLLYIGISSNAIARLGQHGRDKTWFNEIANITVEYISDRKSAYIAEANAIYNEKPKYNKTHKSEKQKTIAKKPKRVSDDYIIYFDIVDLEYIKKMMKDEVNQTLLPFPDYYVEDNRGDKVAFGNLITGFSYDENSFDVYKSDIADTIFNYAIKNNLTKFELICDIIDGEYVFYVDDERVTL